MRPRRRKNRDDILHCLPRRRLGVLLGCCAVVSRALPLAQERLGLVGTQELEVGSGRTRDQHRAALRVFRPSPLRQHGGDHHFAGHGLGSRGPARRALCAHSPPRAADRAPRLSLGLLYPLLLPIRFAEAESILVEYPFLGIHVVLTLLGHVGFALAFCSAVGYLVQHQALKKGRLNRYLPALDTAAAATFRFAGGGFSLFTLGLGMGVIWLFGAPGEHLAGGDTKIWLALPTWFVFGIYLYLRGIGRRHGRRLKWLVIAGFVLGLIKPAVGAPRFRQFRLVRRRNSRSRYALLVVGLQFMV